MAKPKVKPASSPNKAPRLSTEEKRWRAQSDVRILSDAAAIKADKSRLSAAKREALKTIKALQQASKLR